MLDAEDVVEHADRVDDPVRIAAAQAQLRADFDEAADTAKWWARKDAKAEAKAAKPAVQVATPAGACRHLRRLGGVCDTCGDDDGGGFMPDPDRAGHRL